MYRWSEKLETLIFPATLDMIFGGGQREDMVDRALAQSCRGSRAYSESEGKSLGNSISTNSPGQIIVEAGNALRTTAWSQTCSCQWSHSDMQGHF